MEKDMNDIIKENMIKMFVKPASPKVKREIKLDERTFIDKKFENKLLKKFWEVYYKLLKRASSLERKFHIWIHTVTWKWKINWVNYYVSLNIDERLMDFSFEIDNWDEIDLEILYERGVLSNEYVLVFENSNLEEHREKEIISNLTILKTAMKR